MPNGTEPPWLKFKSYPSRSGYKALIVGLVRSGKPNDLTVSEPPMPKIFNLSLMLSDNFLLKPKFCKPFNKL